MDTVIVNIGGLDVEFEPVPYVPEIGEYFHGRMVASVRQLEPENLFLVSAQDGSHMFIAVKSMVK